MAAETLNARYEIIDTAPDADTLPFVVARARDITDERVVTLQTLPVRRITGGSDQRAAFVAAVLQAGRLDHANIARLYDHGATSEGDLYVVSEYTRGITLKERIRRIAPFSLAVAADIAVAIAEALEYAHGQGVVHGDLRPHHILLSPEGQIKVTGFAYSRAAVLLAGEGPDPLYVAYAAPDLGEHGTGSVPADLYALGVTLYEMLTGALPTLAAAGPPSPRGLNPGVPPALEGVVQKALYPDPGARYRSASAMLADLRAVREALRTGRSLAWSPVAEKRFPRPPDPADTVVTRLPQSVRLSAADEVSPLAVAAAELNEEREPAVGRGASRALSITLAFLFVVAVLGIIGLSWYATRFLAIPNDVTVPSLIGKTFDNAKQIAAQGHFNLVEKDPDKPHYSTRWAENQIIQQDPPEGRTIKAGRDVVVVRSAGPPLLPVPDLSGMTQARALRALQDANLPTGTTNSDYSDTIPKDLILSQSPAKRAMVARETPVNFVVSRGKQPPDVPDGVSADARDATTVVLTWKHAPRAASYSVSRDQGGEPKTVADNVQGTSITDSGLTPQTTYTYTVSAVNVGGTSEASVPVTAITPPVVPTPPVIPPDTPSGGTGDAGSGTSGADTGASETDAPAPASAAPDTGSPRMRQFTIKFRVPRHPRRDRRVQFEVQDSLGLNWPFDEYRTPGSEVDSPVQAFGNRITFRIFLDGKLAKQQTL